ncbi:U-box domain-containing protein 9-like [Wolffia australiana]
MGLARRRGSAEVVKMAEEELKMELCRLAEAISSETASMEVLDRAAMVVVALKEQKFGCQRSQGTAMAAGSMINVPEHFLCPISSEIMKDPVVLATGETYDRTFIQAWLSAGHRTCPKTEVVLPHCDLTPNHSLQRLIADWCATNGVDQPTASHGPDRDCAVTRNDRAHLAALLLKLSSPAASDQKKAAAELRLQTKTQPAARALLGDAVPLVLPLLTNPELQEDAAAILLNISILDENKTAVGVAIPGLVEALQMGSMATRSNAAAALFSLSALDCNKKRIGEAGAMAGLVRLLEEGSGMAKRDALAAVFSLCMAHENRARAVAAGAVGTLVKAVEGRNLAGEALSVLAMLAGDHCAAEEMVTQGGVAALLRLLREGECGRDGENSAAILWAICGKDRARLREVRDEEEMHGTLSRLVQSGTARARRKAASLLERVDRTRALVHSV